MRGNELGIITGGVAYQYAREIFPDASILKLGMVYPIPKELILNFSKQVKKLIVLEELDPFIEDQVRLMGVELYQVDGKVDTEKYHTKSLFPIAGELNPAIVKQSAMDAGLIQGQNKVETSSMDLPLPARPPTLCPGCPHRSSFYVLSKLKVPVNGDIGCYTLGVAPPLSTIDTCGCMGASIGVAHGAAVAGDKERHVSVIGDSTFFHTGIPALINIAYNRSNVITIIMDNRVTGMTGHQDNPGTGFTLQNQKTVELDIEALVKACGIEKVLTVDELSQKQIEVKEVNWISGITPSDELHAQVKIRYKADFQNATVIPVENNKVIITFENPVRDATPGQYAVFYDDDELLGGGEIEKTL